MSTKSGGKGRSEKGGADRALRTRVKSARGRKVSSTRWLERQLNDPYVQKAKRMGYRSRAAFKLIELDDKFHFLTKGAKILDLGAAPGGWTQVALERAGKDARVVGIDLLEVEAIAGADLLQGDFLDDDAPERLRHHLNGPADVVLTDMAASATALWCYWKPPSILPPKCWPRAVRLSAKSCRGVPKISFWHP